ncbi:MAG: protein kinase [Crocosphaera sp.]
MVNLEDTKPQEENRLLKKGDKLKDNRYQVTRFLGKGGFGETWMVNDELEGREKVVKVLISNTTKTIELFKREATVLKELKHSGIPKVALDGDFSEPIPGEERPIYHFLIMEYIEGQNLEEWLTEQSENSIDSEQGIEWLKQLVEILDLVHEKKYFHRDIKPENIMLKPDGQLILIDFGGVKEITQLEKTGTGLRSPGYSPPEQINRKAVPQSDFFALGRTLVYLLTGQEPRNFSSEPKSDPFGFKINPNWSENVPNIPKAFANLLNELMAFSPEDRPENTQIILQRLALISIQSTIEPIINDLKIPIPGARTKAKNILDNTWSKWVEDTRIPIIGLYGRTNSGKSSLINAIMGQEIAKVGKGIKPTTKDYESYQCSQNGWKREFIDSRGVGEKIAMNSDEEAVKTAINKIINNKLDILLFVVLAVEVGYAENDIHFLQRLKEAHQKKHKTELPIILVINKIDQVPDPDEWSPPYNLDLNYSSDNHDFLNDHEEKELDIKGCIEERLNQYEKLTQDYIPVCTYYNWRKQKGRIYNIEELEEKMQSLVNDDLVKYSFSQSSSFRKLRRDVASNFCEAAAQISWFIFFIPNQLPKLQKNLVILIKSLADQEESENIISLEEFWEDLSMKQKTDNKILAFARTFQIGIDAIRCFFDYEELETVKNDSIDNNNKIESNLPNLQKLEKEEKGEDEVMRRLKERYREMQERYGLKGSPRKQDYSSDS